MNVNRFFTQHKFNYIDLQCEVTPLRDTINPDKIKGEKLNLSEVVNYFFDKPLSKDYRFSNWKAEQLSEPQIKYASLDAVCLFEINDQLDNINIDVLNIHPNESDHFH